MQKKNVCAILIEGLMRKIGVKGTLIWTSGSGVDAIIL